MKCLIKVIEDLLNLDCGTTEGLLDADFDIKDSDLIIGNNYPINHNTYEVLAPMTTRIFSNCRKEFNDHPPVTPKHMIDSAYGIKNPVRYFLDWIAAQPVSMLYDDQFTTRKPKLAKAFDEWIYNKRFSITMVKYSNEKTVYFNYNDYKILRVNFK